MTSSRGPINRHVNRRRSMKRRVKSRRRRRQVPSAECRSFERSRAMEADAADPTRKNATLRRIATAWRRLVSYMFRPEDGECLAVLRIAFGKSIFLACATRFIRCREVRLKLTNVENGHTRLTL